MDSLKQELAPISFKRPSVEQTLDEQVPQGVAMFSLNDTMRYFLCPGRTDMRKDISSLCGLVHEKMNLVHAEDSGMLMYVKRLKAGRFKLPKYNSESNSYPMEWRDLVILLKMIEGLNASVASLSAINKKQAEQNEKQQERIKELTALVAGLNRQLFGRKSEKFRVYNTNMPNLFADEFAGLRQVAEAKRDEAVEKMGKESAEEMKRTRRNRKMMEDLAVLESEVVDPDGVDLSLYRKTDTAVPPPRDEETYGKYAGGMVQENGRTAEASVRVLKQEVFSSDYIRRMKPPFRSSTRKSTRQTRNIAGWSGRSWSN